MRRRFLPTARDTNWLLIAGFLSLGYALYLRYMVVQDVPVGLACDAGAKTWLCLSRTAAIALGDREIFGWAAIAVAGVNLIRPSVLLFAIALAVTNFGLVLHNSWLAGLAAALLILSFARPASGQG